MRRFGSLSEESIAAAKAGVRNGECEVLDSGLDMNRKVRNRARLGEEEFAKEVLG